MSIATVTNRPLGRLGKMHPCSTRSATVALLLLTGCFSTTQVTLPTSVKRLPVGPGAFPHATLSQLLAEHVDERGRVDYRGLRDNRRELERYLVAIAETSPHKAPAIFPSREHSLAYWLNAYNAYVLYAITERPNLRSVHDSETDFFYWQRHVFGGEELSLYHLENDVIRAEFADPRIHFALNCASAGCPALPREAFVPARLEEQLARETRKFCADATNVRHRGTAIQMSQIFEWFAEDFAKDGGPIEFCRKWGRDLPADAAVTSYIPYDWALNVQPGRELVP